MNRKLSMKALWLLAACAVLFTIVIETRAFDRNANDYNDVVDALRKIYLNRAMTKRRLDMGYGNRFDLAASIGSKLMALKHANDLSGPGRK
ncbi:DgyrCDS13595 [Dimorphilus gyrociliatus]|uniref:DgyrCDS13595 n=1 Tax=Dimorphilus gyrociliatus TaxID=2664684 RepID=A0A7I8WB38_9ANNE|nr:DgyrCDS13595 [Dimorphilus gyrociliatus]